MNDYYSLGLALQSRSQHATPTSSYYLYPPQRHQRHPERPYSSSGRIQKLSPARSTSRISTTPASATSSPHRQRIPAHMSRPFGNHTSYAHLYQPAQHSPYQVQQMQIAAQRQQMLQMQYAQKQMAHMQSANYWTAQTYQQPRPSYYQDTAAADFQLYPWQSQPQAQPQAQQASSSLGNTLLMGSAPAPSKKSTEPELVGLGLYDTSSKEPSSLLTGFSGKGLKLEESWQPSDNEDDDELDADTVPDLEDEPTDEKQQETAEWSPVENLEASFDVGQGYTGYQQPYVYGNNMMTYAGAYN